MLMPEATMHKDDRLVPGKDEIGFPGQMFRMQSITQTSRMHCFADQQLRLCVAAPDCSHIPAAGCCVVNVGHTSSGFALPRWFHQRLDMRLHDPGDRLEDGHGH